MRILQTAKVVGTVLALIPVIGFCQDRQLQPTWTQKIGNITFSLPTSLKVEKVAGEPLVHWPMMADWDPQGRLVVVESGGVARPIVEHNKRRLHRIVRLVDENGDGVFDRRVVAADQLPFTEGVLCIGNDLIAAAPPEILKLTDEDGDGFCEKREVWFDGQTITGCANDLHGPYFGTDTWIYWCKGAFAEQTHELADGKILKDKAAHIFRRRLEGGPIESVISGGMDNPVEVAFSPEGDMFFTSTFLQHPGDGKRDGIAHAVYGSVFGKDHSAINGLVRTGPLMPIMTHLGPAAPSGLACLSNELLGHVRLDDIQRTLVSAQFNLQKVAAHTLVPNGSSYGTVDADILVADRVDFHPTDVLEDASGGLLVIDTGGWYDLCCPTSRVDQQVASGGIYRISPKEAPAFNATTNMGAQVFWPAITPESCLELLHDPRPWIRRNALVRLSAFGNRAVPGAKQMLNDHSQSLAQRHRALSALSRIGTDEALEVVAEEAGRFGQSASSPAEASQSLCQAACHLIALHRYERARPVMQNLATSEVATIARAAVEAIGRLESLPSASRESVEQLMHLVESAEGDRILEHSLLYALIEIGDTQALSLHLSSRSPGQRRLAFMALEQLNDRNHLNSRAVFEAAKSKHDGLRQSAIEILEAHQEWAGESIGNLDQLWNSPDDQAGAVLLRVVRAWRSESSVQQLVSNWLAAEKGADRSIRINQVLACWKGEAPPSTWIASLVKSVAADPAGIAPTLAELDLRQASCGPLVASMLDALENCRDVDLGSDLLAALPARDDINNDWLVERLMADGDYRLLNNVQLTPSQADRLFWALPTLTSQQVTYALETLASMRDEALDSKVLDTLLAVPVARTLPVGYLSNVYAGSRPAIRQKAADVSKLLLKPTADIEAAVQAMLVELEGGDPVRGLEIFRGQKASCSACHQMGYVGGNIGPELTRIGRSRTRAALLEALLFPSARIEQSYQSSKILTHDGQILNGLIRAENDSALVVHLAADRAVSVLKQEIELVEPSQLSVMPTGLRSVLTLQELADLLALLESAR